MKAAGNKFILPFLLISFPFLSVCTSLPEGGKGSSVIRYVNIKVVYEHALNNDKEFVEINNKRQTLIDKKNSLTKKQQGASSGESTAEEIKQIDRELAALFADEDVIKLRIYRKIGDIIRDMARRRGIDFIFNIGDVMVYAKTEFDITEDVISELNYRDDRVSPLWK